ncbi:type I-F CRISPR-associated protein Csy1 [Taylorella equigenitalis]|uniref:type I-F CRISPR-associated protein Csy1 n=1 Tax=Taylorella equigenitalis TaxID=29575 RepID=UPI0004060446|nr:type I-F CRISPR-associated protein Csy1 [Taylorella equigenitalis]ASY29989.1 CRISPR-associated protein Csy1 [Taylorella equigenitalis]KOS59035.1 CRISPR-associated protein Csy1 [Taylorella equigenitalis]
MDQIEVYREIIEQFFDSDRKYKDLERSHRFKNLVNKFAEDAKHIVATKYPSKFTHPDSKVNIKKIDTQHFDNDGYVREGNCGELHYKTKIDYVTSASYLPIVKFYEIVLEKETNFKLYEYLLSLRQELIDNNRLPEKNLFREFDDATNIVKKLLIPFESSTPNETSPLLKQLLFPIRSKEGIDEYVNVSVLSNSPLMCQLNSVLSKNSKSDNKQKDEEKQEQQEDFYIPNLVKYKLGGGHPKNISSINHSKQGIWYVLPCLPPSLDNKYIRKPFFSFFKECLSDKYSYGTVKKLEKLTTTDINNIHIRTAIDNYLDKLINMSIEKALIIRTCKAGWSDNKKFSSLSAIEKEFLDSKYEKISLSNVNLLAHELTKWLINRIETNTLIKLEDSEFLYIKKKFLNQITLNWEVFND